MSELLSAERKIEFHIRESWQRCSVQFSLQRSTAQASRYVGLRDLNQRRVRMSAVLSIAQAEMRGLRAEIDEPVGVALTDADGVIVAYDGDAAFAALAQRAGMREGALWSEEQQGTNGMGTCLVAAEPLLVHASDHYLRQNTAFSCCASPIRDVDGRVLGVLNVSCVSELGWAATLARVVRAAQVIETHLLLSAEPHAHVLRIHPVADLVTGGSEGLLVVDRGGAVLGANRSASQWLGQPVSRLACRKLDELFPGLSFDELCRAAGDAPWTSQPLPGTGLFGLLQLPGPVQRKVVETAVVDLRSEDPLAAAERAVLLAIIEACSWNMTAAARRLRLGRKTLYRKMAAHGLARPATEVRGLSH